MIRWHRRHECGWPRRHKPWGEAPGGGPAWRERLAQLRMDGRGLYRSRQGVVLGVCRGLAERFDLSVGWVRFFVVLGFVCTGFWPVGVLYLVAALVMKPAPVIPPASAAEEEFYRSYADNRRRALERLNRTFDGLERRLRRMEDVVTSRGFDWERRMG